MVYLPFDLNYHNSMKITVAKALQQGAAFQKEGKLQDAERLYNAILQSQPLHPEANHNLGMLAVSANKSDEAVPLFKTALKANPKNERFWLSYIEALIKENKNEAAKKMIDQAIKRGINQKKLDALRTQLGRASKLVKPHGVGPTNQQLVKLSAHYQKGRLGDAEKLAMSLTQQFPKHQFGWKVLGGVYAHMGRTSEAISANKTAVELSPQDTEAHYNLAIVLKALGRLDEAESSYRQVLALEPKYVTAHYNLGIMLQELARYDEAEASYAQAIALEPNLAEARNNLGVVLQELGRLDEAEASYAQAIALDPDLAEARNNLGGMLSDLNRLDEAEANTRQAIELDPDNTEAHETLGIILLKQGRHEEGIKEKLLGVGAISFDLHNGLSFL